jgi:hypothetical protein
MQVTLEIPDEIAKECGGTPEKVARKVLEDFVLSEYNAWRIGHFQVQQMLGLKSWSEAENFLREHKAPLQYGIKELEEDMETFRKMDALTVQPK